MDLDDLLFFHLGNLWSAHLQKDAKKEIMDATTTAFKTRTNKIMRQILYKQSFSSETKGLINVRSEIIKK